MHGDASEFVPVQQSEVCVPSTTGTSSVPKYTPTKPSNAADRTSCVTSDHTAVMLKLKHPRDVPWPSHLHLQPVLTASLSFRSDQDTPRTPMALGCLPSFPYGPRAPARTYILTNKQRETAVSTLLMQSAWHRSFQAGAGKWRQRRPENEDQNVNARLHRTMSRRYMPTVTCQHVPPDLQLTGSWTAGRSRDPHLCSKNSYCTPTIMASLESSKEARTKRRDLRMAPRMHRPTASRVQRS
ncbi:hypothetical protein OH76DRAFT_1213119 [Lentinus brumalis]|uniref:Uncharacterized protein n=1 Tax=Lentinus brumalis TaxID=2498619 RepID=A0A371DLD4_9APHY|nr:hypothetical protein OH76DRAFT_1213119 [Polyporus brumalis]